VRGLENDVRYDLIVEYLYRCEITDHPDRSPASMATMSQGDAIDILHEGESILILDDLVLIGDDAKRLIGISTDGDLQILEFANTTIRKDTSTGDSSYSVIEIKFPHSLSERSSVEFGAQTFPSGLTIHH